jgi:hypothetical protein
MEIKTKKVHENGKKNNNSSINMNLDIKEMSYF